MIEGLKPYPAYKDSGVEWLGKVPAHWEVRRLKRICRLAYGDALATNVRQDGPVPVYGSNGRVGTHSIANTKAPCIVIGRKGSFGKVNLSCEPVFAIDTTFFVDSRFTTEEIHWLYYLLEWLRLDELSKDSAVPGLDREDAYKRIAAVPPLPEQTAIVRFLDWAERRILRVIRARQRQIKLLEEYKQALIHQAVTGKIDIRTGQPYPAYKPSGVEWLCEVPAHWEILPLKWLAKCYRNGATPPTTKNFYYMGGTIPWYSPSSFDSGEIVSAPIRFVSNAAIEDGVARLIHGPALLVIVIGATAGRMTLMEQDGTTNQQITAFELPYDWKTCVFLLRQLRFSESWLRENASTATIPILNTNIVTHLPCLLPPPKERCAIVEYLDAQTAKIDAVIAG